MVGDSPLADIGYEEACKIFNAAGEYNFDIDNLQPVGNPNSADANAWLGARGKIFKRRD
jgi:hypothetical protein